MAGSLNLVKSNSGTLTLTSAIVTPARQRSAAGTLVSGITNVLPTTTALTVMGTFDMAGFAQQVASITGNGIVTDSAAAANFTVNNSGADTFAGTMTGSLNLVKVNSGTLTLSGASTYTAQQRSLQVPLPMVLPMPYQSALHSVMRHIRFSRLCTTSGKRDR